jgi:hypothetical protein
VLLIPVAPPTAFAESTKDENHWRAVSWFRVFVATGWMSAMAPVFRRGPQQSQLSANPRRSMSVIVASTKP